jgi:hypothetical protein
MPMLPHATVIVGARTQYVVKVSCENMANQRGIRNVPAVPAFRPVMNDIPF